LDEISDSNKELLLKYSRDLMVDLQKNSKIKEINNKNTGLITYQEFYPKYSKPIIDKIDDVLADLYRLTTEEREFIKHFDKEFRMGR
jgi:hypothetical protein